MDRPVCAIRGMEDRVEIEMTQKKKLPFERFENFVRGIVNVLHSFWSCVEESGSAFDRIPEL